MKKTTKQYVEFFSPGTMSRELDERVAVEVMGWTLDILMMSAFWGADEDWSPSTSIADAWLVVEEMRKRGWTIFIRYGDGELSTTCVKMYSEEGEADSFVDLLPEAICRAALAALEATND